jgi:hypothetical protein
VPNFEDTQSDQPINSRSDKESSGSLSINTVELLSEDSSSNKAASSVDNPIGMAWLEEDGSITMHLHRTADGQNVNAMFSFKSGDKEFGEVLKHLNGLNFGEMKPVQPFPEKVQP